MGREERQREWKKEKEEGKKRRGREETKEEWKKGKRKGRKEREVTTPGI
jgi:hypothetical protein